jgi:tol-pal system protein YbgF
MLTPFARQCARIVILAGILPLGLGACASDDSGGRALAETAALRTEMGQTRERQEGQARDIARIQSQLRGMETDTGERTREARAVGAELARARVLLEEARAALREQQAAAASVSAARAAAAPSLAVPPPAPSTPSAPPMPIEPLPEPVKSAPPSVAARAPDPLPSAPSVKPEIVRPPPAAKPTPATRPAPAAPAAKPTPAKPAPPVAAVPKVMPLERTAPVEKLPSAEKAGPAADAREVALRPPAPEPPKPAARATPGAEQLFGAAMANLRAQEPGQAVLELTDLIARYPTHALAPAAQLWIGEAYFQQRDYRQSLVELKRVMEGYPRSPQVADALLKSGLCHRALGDRASATAAWEQVVREHPSSAAAGQAGSLLGPRESAARGTR